MLDFGGGGSAHFECTYNTASCPGKEVGLKKSSILFCSSFTAMPTPEKKETKL
jgi:hypothetical protein